MAVVSWRLLKARLKMASRRNLVGTQQYCVVRSEADSAVQAPTIWLTFSSSNSSNQRFWPLRARRSRPASSR